jgi:transposase InsO family protein
MLYELVRQESGELGPPTACEAVGVSRSGYWAWQHAKPRQEDPLLPHIRRIAKQPRYGYRRVTAALRRDGMIANRKRVLTLMRENGLLCRRPRFKVITTDSDHGLPVHSNLARDVEVTAINQLWATDITYVQLSRGFAYLAVIVDVFSRRVIGWQLSRDIDTRLCLDALNMAFATRKGASLAGLVHHSDQGVQYASDEYKQALENRGIRVSMSRRGNPYDNAYVESFNKTVKVEEVYVNEYEGFEHARQNIKRFIEVVYNKKRLHSALGYLPPAEFEQQVLREVLA